MPTAERRLKSYSIGVRVKDAVEDIWEKQQDGRWKCVSKDGAIDMTSHELNFAWGPISKPTPAPSGFPKMTPDGKTKLMYIPGKTDNTPPTVAELEAATEITEATIVSTDFTWGEPTQLEMEEHAAKFGLSLQETAEAFEMLGKILGESYSSPKEELKFRINSWLRDENPGLPVNWPGIERAMARL